MFLSIDRPPRHRYVEFKEGQFVTIHQTKASSRLATQEDKQRFEDLAQTKTSEKSGAKTFQSETEEPQTIFEQKIPPIWKKGVNLIFLVFLIGMAFIIFQLSSLFLSDTQAYLSTNQISIIEQFDQWLILKGEDTQTSQTDPTEMVMTDLTQVLHIHHALNEAYETVKEITRDYASARISAGERNQRLTIVLTEMNQLSDYNQSRLEERHQSKSRILYEANTARLTHFIEGIEQLLEAPYRALSLEQLNKNIEQDQPLFNQQVQAFKDVLDAYQIPYTETNGKLHFSFEGV